MEKRYCVEKYCGRTYCGNGIFDTLDECREFAKDGFCDKAKVYDYKTGKVVTLRF